MPDLKKILGELYTEEIENVLSKYDVAEKGQTVPIATFNELNNQKKELKEQVDTLNKNLLETNKSIETFKKSAEGNEELKKQLQEYQDKINNTQKEFGEQLKAKESEWATREANNRKAFTIREKMLMEHADPKYIDMLMKEVDLEKITEQDGKFIGVDDVVTGVKTNFEKLFGKPQITGTGVVGGSSSATKETLDELRAKAKTGDKQARLELMKAERTEE